MKLPEYPISNIRDTILYSFKENRIPVIDAPPGSGKSTLVPLYLHSTNRNKEKNTGMSRGAILLLQPRRAAVQAIAERLRELANPEAAIGYITRYEHVVPKNPDVIVMTEGIFVRKVLEDPSLQDTAAVLLDEFHERSMQTDLAYVLARQSRDLFRPDMRIGVMSATLDTTLFNSGQFRIIQAHGTLFPVSHQNTPVPPSNKLEQYCATVCQERINNNDGNILVFLPGQAEIHRTEKELSAKDIPSDTEVYPLYGRLSPKDQRKALQALPAGRRKIVLSTNIAETSLTIEGISCVIDSGLKRKPFYNPDTGLTRLETIRISQASAEQRAGRAGRLGPGTVIRLWEHNERLEEFDVPEIQTSDLSSLFLTLAVWGDTKGEMCLWPDAPSEQRRSEALQLLKQLEAIDNRLVPTEKGLIMAKMPIDVRLAAMLAEPETTKEHPEKKAFSTAVLTAAVLETGDPLTPEESKICGADLMYRIEAIKRFEDNHYTRGLKKGTAKRIIKEAERLKKITTGPYSKKSDWDNTGSNSQLTTAKALLSAYPDRIAKHIGQGTYQIPSGRQVKLKTGETGFCPEWIVAGALHISGRSGSVYLAAPLTSEQVKEFSEKHAVSYETLDIDEKGFLNARHIKKIDHIIVNETPVNPNQISNPKKAITELLFSKGPDILPWNKRTEQLKSRLSYLFNIIGYPWPDVCDSTILADMETWLIPFIPAPVTKTALKDIPLYQALLSLVPWKQQQELDSVAPEHYVLPSGSKVPLYYEQDTCRLKARIQQLFGLNETPKAAGNPIEIELLSPARRPVQKTTDIMSFWKNTYPEVRKELRGRYPKHYWPDPPPNS